MFCYNSSESIENMGLRGPKQLASRGLLISTAYPIYEEFWALAQGGRRGVLQKESDESRTVFRGANIPAEPDTIIALLESKTATEVREISRNSSWMAKQPFSPLTRCLPLLAEQFQDAKREKKFPNSDRRSSVAKKFWFLACALAGAQYGVSPRRAVNIIGPGKPEEIFGQPEWRSSLAKRKPKTARRKD